MWPCCSVRLHDVAVAERETVWRNAHFPPTDGARQIYDVEVDMVQTSCGYAVPFFDHQGPRDVLKGWTEDKGPEGIATYWAERNQNSIDGLPTHILSDSDV